MCGDPEMKTKRQAEAEFGIGYDIGRNLGSRQLLKVRVETAMNVAPDYLSDLNRFGFESDLTRQGPELQTACFAGA